MSKEINNSEFRKKAIKDMLKMLHDGKGEDEVKAYFENSLGKVSASEISEAEGALIKEGITAEEIQGLCDIHAAVFKGSIEEIHASPSKSASHHPVEIMKEENKKITELINAEIIPALDVFKNDSRTKGELLVLLRKLSGIKIHYQRKENIFFPYLEKHGVTAPPKVMWAVDDDIRAFIDFAVKTLESDESDWASISSAIKIATDNVLEMIFKEDNILAPLLLETLSDEEFENISKDLPSIGYYLIEEPKDWTPAQDYNKNEELGSNDNYNSKVGQILLPTGALSAKELTGLLNNLPIDITFVDKNDTVKYFSENKERIFPRTKAIIGRKVINCHPPASMHIVETILRDFESGKKSEESFYIKLHGKYIYIRYFAVRDENDEFLGTLEVTQDIAPIKAIEGEKRLMD